VTHPILPLAVRPAVKDCTTSQLIRDIDKQFEAAVAERFDGWKESEVIPASTILDPYVAHMAKLNDGHPKPSAVDDDDMFTAAGAGAVVNAIDAQLITYVAKVREVKGNPPAKLPSSLSWWEANGASLPLVLRVYMNIGSIMMCSTLSEAVFNQLALTVTDRRGALRDDRAAALTLSAAVAKLDREKLAKPRAVVAASDDDALEAIMEALEAETAGVLSAKYVDLVEETFDVPDD
jgi:hypothetical protein